MEITINISNKVAKHIESPHDFYDECGQVGYVMKKVQKEVDKN